MARVGDGAAVRHAREAPSGPRDGARVAVQLVAYEQDRVARVDIGRGIRQVAAVREEEVRHRLRRLEIHVDAPVERPAVAVARLRCLESEESRKLGHVALPAARHDGIAAPHQEPVADIDGRIRVGARRERRPRGVVEVRQGDGVAAVHDVENHAPIAAGALDGQQDRHVGRELHAPVAVPRCLAYVGDPRVRGMLGVEGEAEPPLQLFVGPDATERAAAGQRALERDVEVCNRHGDGLSPSPSGATGRRPTRRARRRTRPRRRGRAASARTRRCSRRCRRRSR